MTLTEPDRSDGVDGAGGERVTAPRGAGRHVPGEAGLWVLVFGDMLVFALLFAVYLVARIGDREVFARSQALLDPTIGAVNTVLLLVSSLLVLLAVRSLRDPASPAQRLVPRLFLGAMACGVAFSVLKVVEYHEKVAAGITAYTDDFFLYYFLLTGFHWFHLILGLCVLAALTVLVRRAPGGRLAPRHLGYVEGGACFWHMVDLLWIVLFPLLYLVR